MRSIIISGGGTGGHIFPALAIADEIKLRYPDCKIEFVGAIGRMEMEKIPAAGYHITGLPISGIQRKKIWKNWNLPFKLLKSMMISNQLLQKYKPQLVIGVGGYASGVITKKAQTIGVPTLLQEQNGFAGVTNKLLSRKAKAICVAYDQMDRFFPKEKLHLTGNPVRKAILTLSAPKEAWYEKYQIEKNKPVILIVGGSLGALSINKAMEFHCHAFIKSGYQVIWQTGKNYSFKEQVKGISCHTFIQDMQEVYALADVIISRAGALSISELCYVGKPTILVPSPNVAEDHQTKNAMSLVDKNAAWIISDDNVKEELYDNVKALIGNKSIQEQLRINIKALAKPNAVKEIVDVAESLIK